MTALVREAAILRRLVEREDFEGVQASLDRFVRLVDIEPSPANLANARNLIEWARRSLCIAHGRLSGFRDRLQAVARYRDPVSISQNQFRLKA